MANTKNTTSLVENKTTTAEKAAKTTVTENDKTVKREKSSDVIKELDEVVSSVSNGDVSVRPSAKEVKLSNEEEIAVRSATFGGLTWISPKTNAFYRWNEIGSVEYIPFGELITMNNTAREFLFDPLVIVQDGRVVDHFRLNETYEKIARVNELEELFNTNNLDEIGSVLRSIVQTNMRDIAISKIRTLRQEHKLNNIDVIRLIEKILCFDLD